MEIGNKIMELKKKNNLSQEDLAEKVGVARQTISKWELGETSPDLKQSKELQKELRNDYIDFGDIPKTAKNIEEYFKNNNGTCE